MKQKSKDIFLKLVDDIKHEGWKRDLLRAYDLMQTKDEYQVKKGKFLLNILMNLRQYPVDICTFVEHPDYLGFTQTLLPAQVELLEAIHPRDDIFGVEIKEVILTGSIGSKKTSSSSFALLYLLYLLSCMRSPAINMGLAGNSELLMSLQSRDMKVTTKAIYRPLVNLVNQSYYFRTECPKSSWDAEFLSWPQMNIKIVPLPGDADAVIGTNLVASLVDEINFFRIITSGEMVFDQAREMYAQVSQRINNRMRSKGVGLGKFYISSSANERESFLALHQKECEGRDDTVIYDKKIWQVIPRTNYASEEFEVFIGDSNNQPIILDESVNRETLDQGLIERVPMDFIQDFKKDITKSIRNILGSGLTSLKPFIKDTTSVNNVCVGENLFSLDKLIFGINDDSLVFNDVEPGTENLPRFLGVDIGFSSSGDNTGISVGYMSGLDEHGAPMVCIDGTLEVGTKANKDLQLADLEKLLIRIANKYQVVGTLFDRAFSTSAQQAMRRAGHKSAISSVDKSVVPYMVFKDLILDQRVLMPNHEKLRNEISRLEITEKNTQTGLVLYVNHVGKGSSKDVADSACNVAYNVLKSRKSWRAIGSNPTPAFVQYLSADFQR